MTEAETCSPIEPKYTHRESATVHVKPTDASPSWSLHAHVDLESKSTITSSSALFGNFTSDAIEPTAGTPFAQHILQLIKRHNVHRLQIQIGNRASSTSTHASSDTSYVHPQSFGPAGTYISASFLPNPPSSSTSDGGSSNTSGSRTISDENDEYKVRYAALLRYLLDNSLFPPCGAPLDSIRERKHGHSIIVRRTTATTTTTSSSFNTARQDVVQVESNLAADGSTFCSASDIILGKDTTWGTSGGACHTKDNWGLIDSLFAPPIDSNAKASSILSELLLGNSDDSFGGDIDERHSIWIEVNASVECFTAGPCVVEVKKGVSYGIGLPSPADDESSDYGRTLQVTLGDFLLGRNTLERSVAKEGWKAWYPCPLSDSSKLVLILPSGFEALIDGKKKHGRIEIDALNWKDEYLDLAEPWAELYRVDQNSTLYTSGPTFGIARTVLRPFGISGPGTLVTSVRVGEDTTSSAVRVESFDVFPGHLLRPNMQSLRIVLFEGGGAGDVNFVPIGGYDYDMCTSDNQCGSYNRTALDLSDLQVYNLTHHTDGTIYFERTVDLEPDSSLWTMIDYDEAYLPFQKFPADANRGVDIFPSRATFTPISASSAPSTTLYSPSVLILPPVPDMSMPFNVISLSCTLWAFVLGSMINILVRRSTESVKRELSGEKEKRPIEKLKDKLCEKGAKLKALFLTLKGTAAKSEKRNGCTADKMPEEKKNT